MSDTAQPPDAGQDADAPGRLARVKAGAAGRWQRAQQDHLWLRHVVDAWGLLTRNHGNQYAGAITYFSFLALFPMLLLAVSVTGFVLSSHPGAEADLFRHITDEVPGEFGTTLSESVQTAIDKRTGVGIVGLLGVLLTGLGWIGNLREAIDAVWGRAKPKRNFLAERLSNLLVLAGLGVGILVSLALTVVGTSLTDQILDFVGLDELPGSTIVLKILGIAIAVAGDSVIFWWLLVRLPDVEVDKRIALRGAILASVGFEILKILGTYTIAHSAGSATAGPFAGIIAVLVWIQLVMRWMLFSCAWIATVNTAARTANSVPVMPVRGVDGTAAAGPDTPQSAVRPATVGATLVGAGAIAGAVATWAATRDRRDRED
ncbi:membrane protein [Jatrophihabitans endophyticus]|uniref:Membrane protein n=1 Tax=Jatrophihabitans endophyticus TaxID=1206085 RepID=A0A1M5GC27_9ACTN|nr:YhjD/YihY/BrkB family envelope integrity protein [Jatrophihabitans endophyticus]SHG01041.1 membrane protein [Jatrophihabitans endophyticus]